jgi:hypothetical protein
MLFLFRPVHSQDFVVDTPSDHPLRKTSAKPHSRQASHKQDRHYDDILRRRSTSHNDSLCNACRRGGGGSVRLRHTIRSTFRAPLTISLSLVRALSVSSSISVSASPGSFRQGTRTLGRSAVRTRFPWEPLPLIMVPHRRGVTRLLWRISRRHYDWRRIRRGLGRGPRRIASIFLPFCPPDLRARTHASNILHSGGLRRFFPAAANLHSVHYFRVPACFVTSRYPRSSKDSIRAFRAIFDPIDLVSLLSRDKRILGFQF